MTGKPSSLIINSPYLKPDRYWDQDDKGKLLSIQPGRRPAAYELYDTRTNTRRVEKLECVNAIRERLDDWRDAGWPGVTSVTRQLLEHWFDRGEWNSEEKCWIGGPRQYPLYFCQLEAIEALIWWLEAPQDFRQGIFLSGDGGPWERICNKMATGSGKTSVMALIITWQALNALHYPKDSRFSKAVLIVTPGLTVKSRLQVLYPGHEKNVYDEFRLCVNEALRQRLNQAELLIENWHTLMPLKEQDRSVVKKGRESDEAFTRRVLGGLAAHKDLIVINDEAHHAYRKPAELKISKKEAEELGIDLDEATRWIDGLDRIHKTRRIRRCFDLSATSFAPTGKTNTEAGLFSWIISDFGLNDAIEAGLVKTPRIVVRDDALPNAKSYRSKLYHLYREAEVSQDLNRKAAATDPLPDLVQKAYAILAYDWRETAQAWANSEHTIPPVLLTVCNRTETAARIEQFFNSGKLNIPSLWHQDPVRKQILFALNMDTVVAHVSRFVSAQNTEKLEAVFDELQPIGSTARMRSWVTTKPCQATVRSQISHAVYDSAWEKVVADLCEKEPHVLAWTKSDHLDFISRYLWRGSSRNFVPDYLIRLNNGKTLVLEVKGVDDERNRVKRAAMAVWIKTVNEQGGFGQWCFDVVFEPSRTRDVILQHAGITIV